MKNNQERIISSVSSFLNLDKTTFELIEKVHANKASNSRRHYYLDKLPGRIANILSFFYKRKLGVVESLSKDSKQIISTMLQPEIEKLAELMNQDLSDWLAFKE